MAFVHGCRPIFIFLIFLVKVRKLSMRYVVSALRAARQLPSPESLKNQIQLLLTG